MVVVVLHMCPGGCGLPDGPAGCISTWTEECNCIDSTAWWVWAHVQYHGMRDDVVEGRGVWLVIGRGVEWEGYCA